MKDPKEEFEYEEEEFEPEDEAPPGHLTADGEPGDCAGEEGN